MDQEELRRGYTYFMEGKTVKSVSDFLDIYCQFFFQVILNHQKEDVYSYAEGDSKILLQMIFSKTLHLKKILEGVKFESNEGIRLNSILDPTIFATITRNVYETIGVFNLVHISSNSKEERNFIHALWVIAGLKYRQRFDINAISEETKKKVEKEKKQIESLTNEVIESDLYKNLDDKSKGIIDQKLKRKDFKVAFEDGHMKDLSWQDIAEKMGLTGDIFDNIYTFFSLYAHPSNVSVFQFGSMFSEEDRAFESLTLSNTKYLFSLLSVFVADYIRVFPVVKETYEKQDLLNQIVLNAYNHMLRNGDSINDSWKVLG